MYDSPNPIDNSEKEAIRDDLISLRWNELQTTGQTIFESDEETRIINRDEIMHEVMGEMGSDNLYFDIVSTPLTYSTRVQKAFKVKIDELMQDAIGDFYEL